MEEKEKREFGGREHIEGDIRPIYEMRLDVNLVSKEIRRYYIMYFVKVTVVCIYPMMLLL